MFEDLEEINVRPAPFQFYTTDELWTDEYTSRKMLEYHLHETIDAASRNREFIDRSVDWIVSRFRVGTKTKIADFGCGPGLYTSRFAEHNAEVTGIDFSARSIQYAKEIAARKGLEIQYVTQNYLQFAGEKRFDLITMIMCDYCALSLAQRVQLLRIFYELLEPGGSVLLDVYTLKAFEQREEVTVCEVNLLDGFWSPDKYFGFLNTFKYDKEKVILDKYTIIEKTRTRTIYNWLQYYSLESLKNEFEENGFKIEECFSDVAGSAFNPDSIEMAIIAKRA